MTYKDAEIKLIDIRKKQFRKNCLLHDIDDIKKLVESERQVKSVSYQYDKVSVNQRKSPTENKCIKIIDTYQSKINKLCDEYEYLDKQIELLRYDINKVFENSDMTVAEYEVLIYYYFGGKSIGEVAKVSFYSYGYVGQLKRQGIQRYIDYLTSAEICDNLL